MSVKLLNSDSNIADIGNKFSLAKRNLPVKASKLHLIVFSRRIDRDSSTETRQLTRPLSYHPNFFARHTSARFFTRRGYTGRFAYSAALSVSLLSILHDTPLPPLSVLTRVCNSLLLPLFAIIVHGVDGPLRA